jgi:hypothetical protein
MSSPDPLSELRDLHLPAAVSPWPPAPGWWILLAFSVMLMVAIGYFLAHTLDSRKYRRKALAEHRKICSLEGDKERIQNFLELLRRTVISATGENHSASLSTDEFLNFLQESCSKKSLFNCDREKLDQALYSPILGIEIEGITDLCNLIMTDSRRWILDHKVTQAKV